MPPGSSGSTTSTCATIPPAPHRELWQHVAGCRAWLVVTRDVRTHAILKVEPARDVALARAAVEDMTERDTRHSRERGKTRPPRRGVGVVVRRGDGVCASPHP